MPGHPVPEGRAECKAADSMPQWVLPRCANTMVDNREGGVRNLLGAGIAFTIWTNHRNLLYMNNHGSRKVLQWKLYIQHYDDIIEHVPDVMNTPADVFSRLIETNMNHVMILTCSATQRDIIRRHHEWLCAHN